MERDIGQTFTECRRTAISVQLSAAIEKEKAGLITSRLNDFCPGNNQLNADR
jgi:hypothetical protein